MIDGIGDGPGTVSGLSNSSRVVLLIMLAVTGNPRTRRDGESPQEI
jgi:hypothetical protein